MSSLPTLNAKVSDKDSDGDTASPPTLDKAETQAQAGHPDSHIKIKTEFFSVDS